jgi:hypothetical protein
MGHGRFTFLVDSNSLGNNCQQSVMTIGRFRASVFDAAQIRNEREQKQQAIEIAGYFLQAGEVGRTGRLGMAPPAARITAAARRRLLHRQQEG